MLKNIDTFFGKAEGVEVWMLSLGSYKAKNQRGRRPQGFFWPWKLPGHNIHHATPKTFPKNTNLYNSQTIKLDFLPAYLAPRDYPGIYTPLAFTNSVKIIRSKSALVYWN